MKKVLITNFNIVNYSGSELDSMTIANYFYENNYEVDIFTLKKDAPLLNMINPKIRIITISEKEQLSKNYDIIWAHHYPLLDYLLFEMKIKSKQIVYLSLSTIEAYESLPDYCNDLTLIGAMTTSVKEVLINEGCKEENIYLFPNYATKDFFNTKRKINKKIKKICIVSNHVPDELKELKEKCQKNGIEVDIYGQQYTPKYIDPDALKDYDVIISIGRTVYYGMAMGIPVYCYDHFGGYGYIDKRNLEETFKYNFSGKGFGVKKSAEEMFKEIINDYENTCKDQEILKEFATKNFDFDKNMHNILMKLKKIGPMDFTKIERLYSKYNRKGRLFVEKVSIYEQQLNYYKNEAEYYKNQYNMIINSTSWKITKWIRFIKKNIVKVMRGIKNEK